MALELAGPREKKGSTPFFGAASGIVVI